MELEKHKILVIDDNRDFCQVVAMDLERAGFETLLAVQGRAGLEMAKAQRPDLILCDVYMHVMSGYEVLQELRKEPATATIPFILMTGKAHRKGMRTGMGLGADDYLVKPFEVGDLLATIRAQLQKQQARRRHAEEKLDVLRDSLSMALPHELKTPLSGILTGAEMILDAAEAPAEVKELAGIIHESGERLRRLVENMLIYAQIELLAREDAEVAALRRRHTPDPAAVMQRVAERHARKHDRLADLRVQSVHRPASISEAYLEKIMDELLDNAFKFSEPGTPVEAAMYALGEDLLVRVHDRGRGMDARQLERIGAYMQFGRKMHEQQGTGLGLHIVKRLTHLHDGQFSITSGPDGGTTVELLLKGVEG